MREEFIFSEKYRPNKVSECILPIALKNQFQAMVDQGDVPNLMLVGKGGVGKTTIAEAMLKELGVDYYFIAASIKGNIDTLRNEMTDFASTVSFKGKRKYIILDEADFMTHQTQPPLRNFMQDFSNNCGFILTLNYLGKMLPEIQSRCSIIDFTIPKNESPKIASQFYERAVEILKKEKVDFSDKVLAEVIMKFFPDFRRTLNEIQTKIIGGKLDPSILKVAGHVDIKELLDMMKAKNFTAIRTWIGENNIDNNFFHVFYEEASSYFSPNYIPELIVLINQYMYKATFAIDVEINVTAFLVEVMVGADYK